MTLDEFDALASLHLDGALPPERAEELNRALAGRPELAARFVRLGRVHGALREFEAMKAGDVAVPPSPRLRWTAYLPVGIAAAFLLGLVVLLLQPEPESGPTVGRDGGPEALLVVGRAEPLAPGDRALRDRLVQLGFRVTPVKDAAVGLEATRGRSLLVLSESTVSTEVGNRLADAAVPILNCEPNLNEALRLATRSARPGEVCLRDKQRALRIVDPSHPLAAGLSGTVPVYAGRDGFVAWGYPDSDRVRIVARCDTAEGEPALFGGEAGFPARRLGFFLPANTNEAERLTSEGWALFDAAVRWLQPGR